GQQGDQNATQFRSLYKDDCPHFSLLDLLPDLQRHNRRIGMKRLITAVGLISLLARQAFAAEHSALARVTVYWPSEGSAKSAAWNGARLREYHCAVDPKKIPYGSKVTFDDGECTAVDSGPDVVKRKAARSCGRTTAERNAIVIDRFFDTKERALTWERAHPHFMTVRVLIAEAK
ncbi:MAG TPA: hypothetical protein VN825_00115, partial [Candidatus Acidoferrum sp.]|nr:hypothetical protein [Candidatus Acidoferrum sp.]